MIILRLFLYLICVISIGWSVLVFGGPPIIKRLISGYSDGALTPSGVTVSPRLGISISRLEFNVQNETAGLNIKGFSRAMELEWSLFGEQPFLEITLGPSVVKDYATADSVIFFTPSFQKIDWQNIALSADISNLVLNPSSVVSSLTLKGNLNSQTAKISDVNIHLEKFNVENESSNYSAHLITGSLAELNLNVPLAKQALSSTFLIENIIVSQPDITVEQAKLEILMDEASRNFKSVLRDIKLPEFGGALENLRVDGNFNQLNVLQELNISSKASILFKKSPKFSKILARVKKLGNKQYQANIQGNLEEFELSDSDNLIGILPGGNFVVDLMIDRAIPTLTSTSKINFGTLDSAEIFGLIEMGFSSELLTNFKCAFSDCKLADFDLFYKLNFDDEWVKGSSNCPKSLCSIAEMDHLIRTSNTIKVFTILNETNIFTPLSSLYLYSVINSGQKINEGHELKFQF